MGDTTDRLLSGHPEIEVWAAGGAVWRVVDDRIEILLVHRQRRDDWSLPKGKLDPDETLRACALREVEEETGYRCRTGKRLSMITYPDARGRRKAVVYWSMSVVSGGFVPNDEVDAVGWFDAESARVTLTYAHDVDVVDEVEKLISSSTISE